MVHSYIEKAKSIMQWGKIMLPLSFIRFYPPQFILRNPVLEGVNAAFNKGHEVVVMVFHIANINELAEQLGPLQHAEFIKALKSYFRIYIEQNVDKNDMITLHNYYVEGLSLLMRVNYDKHALSDLNILMETLTYEVEKGLKKLYPGVHFRLDSGYMFVDRSYYSIQDSIYRAHRQAVGMAEKRGESALNEMTYNLKKIIIQRNISLLAQPIIDVATGDVRAWEILSRGPKGTLLESPMTLFSVARQTGMLYELEMMVCEKALQQIKTTGFGKDIFINFTPLTIGNMKFPGDLKKLMQKYRGICPRQLIFEVTERDSIEEIKHFAYNIKVLRLMGFRIAVDDTGAGYASLNTISEIMPDIIKIDRSVIENIDKNTVKESMLKGLLLVAKEAGSLVVAEGIENEGEASVLTRNNVDLAQGYFYARPAPLIKGIAT